MHCMRKGQKWLGDKRRHGVPKYWMLDDSRCKGEKAADKRGLVKMSSTVVSHLWCFHCSQDKFKRLLHSLVPSSLRNLLSVEFEIGMKKIIDFLQSVADWVYGRSKLGSELQRQALKCTEVLLFLQRNPNAWVEFEFWSPEKKSELLLISITRQSKVPQQACLNVIAGVSLDADVTWEMLKDLYK